jgi:hypothetical protein
MSRFRAFDRRGRALFTAVIMGLSAVGVVLASPAAAMHVEQYIEVPQCQPATGQECQQIPEVPYSADRTRMVAQFTANANGCSDIYVRFNVDHYPASDWLRVSPSQTVNANISTKTGDHVFGVFAKGIEGGCNTGVLNAWGGVVLLDTIETVGPAPKQIPDPVGPAPVKVPCKWRYSGAVVLEQDNGIRVELDQWHDLTAMGPAHLYATPGATVQSNRGEVIGASGEGTDVGFSIVWYDKSGGRAEGNDYTGTIDPEWGTLRGTTVNDAGVRNEWLAHEHWTCK